jgi:hypothetical protein
VEALVLRVLLMLTVLLEVVAWSSWFSGLTCSGTYTTSETDLNTPDARTAAVLARLISSLRAARRGIFQGILERNRSRDRRAYAHARTRGRVHEEQREKETREKNKQQRQQGDPRPTTTQRKDGGSLTHLHLMPSEARSAARRPARELSDSVSASPTADATLALLVPSSPLPPPAPSSPKRTGCPR